MTLTGGGLRAVVAAAALALLTACNMVETKDPLFATADEQGGPVLRPGVWLIGKDGDCQVDEAKPIDTWPSCAGGAVVKSGSLTGHDTKNGKGVWETIPFIFAAGDPRIIQVKVDETVSVSAGAEASGGAEASASASGGGEAHYFGYAGALATKTDDQGRITAISYWPVLCGPPPPKNAKGEDVAGGTKKPFPGMVMEEGGACTTTSTDALRGAAKASRRWADKPMDAHWIRDAAK